MQIGKAVSKLNSVLEATSFSWRKEQIAEAAAQKLGRVVLAKTKWKFWLRHVDDIFVIIKQSEVQPTFGIINEVLLDIMFTTVTEYDKNLRFVDVFAQERIQIYWEHPYTADVRTRTKFYDFLIVTQTATKEAASKKNSSK